MKRVLHLLFTFLAFVCLPALMQGQHREWTQRYDGGYPDFPKGIALDKNQNVYVAGYSWDKNITTITFVAIKYDTNGNELWRRTYPSVLPVGLVVDSTGNAYIVGLSHNTITTMKYDTNGTQVWVRYHEYPSTPQPSYPQKIALDSAGNPVIIGTIQRSFPNSGVTDYLTLKYDPNGNLLWQRTYNRTGLAFGKDRDSTTALATDAFGNIYVTGVTVSPTDNTKRSAVTVKYDSNGTLLWDVRYNGVNSNQVQPYALAVDSFGNVYLAGSFYNAGNVDYLTIKYDTNGNWVWGHSYNGLANGDDFAYALALDTLGNVYVTGGSATDLSSDCVTIKYDTNGNWLWGHRFNRVGASNDYGEYLAIDASDNVFVGGSSVGSSGGSNFITLKYDTNGDWLWGAGYEGTAYSDDTVTGLVVGNDGSVYVTGQSIGVGAGNQTSYDFVTLKYGTTP